jgi:rhodanese-related sulfurtransferase/DNA-binding transcriptional ArsR family regulator
MTRKRQFKDELFEQFARIGKALSSGRRIEILELLAQGERTVEDLAGETETSVANCSRHLQLLRAAQLVAVRRDGLYAWYRLSDERVLALWSCLRELGAARLAEIDRVVQTFFKDRRKLDPVSAKELARRLKEDKIIVLDVRPKLEYEAGHIAGARSIPIAELERRLGELPRRKQVVAYCRGPYCVFADDAVALLRRKGYTAFRLAEGFPDWQLKRLPVVRQP